jgi:hypothetical protein
LALSAGCGQSLSAPGGAKGPTDTDIAETGPGSLPVDVLDYTWSYISNNTGVRISGTVINSSGKPIQGVNLLCVLYDQKGNPIASGDTFVAPTYLKPGARGTFDLLANIKKTSGLTATRLVTVARPLSGY